MGIKIGKQEFPDGFLADDVLPHDGVHFKYIQALHEVLWLFVRHVYGLGAGGHLHDYINKFIRDKETEL